VLAEVAAFLAQKPKINHDGALNLLVQYLRLKPEAARAFHDEMRAGKVPDEVRSFVFLGMELAGGAAARAELIAAADDHKLAGVDRLRAISALSQVPDPDSSVIDALTRAAGERSPEGAERRAGAVLALGVAARDESALSADDKKRVAHYLGAELSRAGSPGDAVAALGGMGNMGDPSFREAAAALVDDPRPGVAVEAYRTLQKLGALPPQGALLDAFARASQQPLKSELSGILSSQKLAPEEVARCAALLAANPPPATRALLITLLGSIARDNADAKAALIRHFPLEKEGQLLALLGRFLTLKDLP
jgi:hypothetical protein